MVKIAPMEENLQTTTATLLDPAKTEAIRMANSFVAHLPYIFSAIIVFVVFVFAALLVKSLLKNRLNSAGTNPLVQKAIINIAFIAFLAIGIFLALKTGGLSGLAFTLVGGTGVLGIGVGLALKSTFENYIAGIILSFRKVFRTGDYVEINGRDGIVQAVNSRSTLIMDLAGNNISIPNSEVYNTTIKNFTNNPKMRTDFLVGIGYEDSINQVRCLILDRLSQLKDEILQDPAPLVCVESLGSATVNIRVYFWFNAVKFSLIKIRSLVIEVVKEELMAAQISLPDDAREIVFANPLQVTNNEAKKVTDSQKSVQDLTQANTDSSPSPRRPMDLTSERIEIQKQSDQSRQMEKGDNLL